MANRLGRRLDESIESSEPSADRRQAQERLAEAERMRADLIATVSHEFRTPLTGIRGAALTLLKRGDRLDKAGRDRLLYAVLDQQERLSRLLENMLVPAGATETDPSASATGGTPTRHRETAELPDRMSRQRRDPTRLPTP